VILRRRDAGEQVARATEGRPDARSAVPEGSDPVRPAERQMHARDVVGPVRRTPGEAAPRRESTSQAASSEGHRLPAEAAAWDLKESDRAAASERAGLESKLRARSAARPAGLRWPTAAGAADAASGTARLLQRLPLGSVRVSRAPAVELRDEPPGEAFPERVLFRLARRPVDAMAPGLMAAGAMAPGVMALAQARPVVAARRVPRPHGTPERPRVPLRCPRTRRAGGALRAQRHRQASWNASSCPTRPIRAAAPGSRWV